MDKLNARVLNAGQNSQRQSVGVNVKCLRPELEPWGKTLNGQALQLKNQSKSMHIKLYSTPTQN